MLPGCVDSLHHLDLDGDLRCIFSFSLSHSRFWNRRSGNLGSSLVPCSVTNGPINGLAWFACRPRAGKCWVLELGTCMRYEVFL